MNIMMLLEMASSAFGDRTAFVDGSDGTRLTYAELFEAARVRAVELQSGEFSRFGMLDVSSLATPVGLFSAAWAGVPYVPINYRLTDPEIEALLARITPAYLVTNPERVDKFGRLDGVHAIVREDFLAERATDGDAGEWGFDPEDTAVLLFTSGTTGAPKAAVLRHKHLVSYILGSVEFAGAGDDEASLVCVPPYHIAGIAAMLSSVYSGRKVVQLANFSAERWLELVVEEHITTAFVVPTMLARIVEALEGKDSADLPDLRNVSYGGGKMPLAIIERAMQLFPETNFTNAYGLTETSSTIAVLGPDDHRAAMASTDEAVRRRLVSVGQALPGVEIEIRDDEGRAVGPNERGEIYVRGEQVSGEYEGRGSVVDADGWFPTRDAGSIDEEGYLFLEGRADDVIVRGGENMSPGEIEDVLLEHAAVRDAAVVGVPSEQWGEAVAAAIVLKPGEAASAADLQAWVRDNMRSSRVPEQLEFWDELPYNETGKLLRRVVREKLGATTSA
ncbi:MAG: class I adenylate-forming enzyme family protein [Pseudomonadota bacterium]